MVEMGLGWEMGPISVLKDFTKHNDNRMIKVDHVHIHNLTGQEKKKHILTRLIRYKCRIVALQEELFEVTVLWK